MRLPRSTREILDEIEKLVVIPLDKLLAIEYLLLEVYDCGFKDGQDTRLDADYNQGYRDSKQDAKDEKYEDENA